MPDEPTRVAMKDEAAEKLRGMLTRMGVDAEVVASEDADRVTLEVRGAESGLVIGKHGATLDALQYLVNKMVARETEESDKPIIVDAEGYRDRRAEALVEMAQRLAEKVRTSGKAMAAAPMSPADRRVMHLALAEEPGVTTQSEGEGMARRLMVLPAKGKAAGAKGAEGSRPGGAPKAAPVAPNVPATVPSAGGEGSEGGGGEGGGNAPGV